MKISVIGYSGAGKSTMARKLGRLYGYPVLHLDRVQFLPGWQDRPEEEAREMVAAFMEQEHWVIDGNYSNYFHGRRLEEADRIVFLNFPRRVCLWQAWRRYRKNRGHAREDMAEGCIEQMPLGFVRWILWGGRTKKLRNNYRDILRRFPDKAVMLKNRAQVAAFWEAEIKSPTPAISPAK